MNGREVSSSGLQPSSRVQEGLTRVRYPFWVGGREQVAGQLPESRLGIDAGAQAVGEDTDRGAEHDGDRSRGSGTPRRCGWVSR